MKSAAIACAAAVLSVLATNLLAQEACSHRGELDALYCDENRDLVADPPKDPMKMIRETPVDAARRNTQSANPCQRRFGSLPIKKMRFAAGSE